LTRAKPHSLPFIPAHRWLYAVRVQSDQVGYHFHFISDDEKAGGHALNFTLSQGTVEIEVIRENSLLLPDTPQFLTAPLPLP